MKSNEILENRINFYKLKYGSWFACVKSVKINHIIHIQINRDEMFFNKFIYSYIIKLIHNPRCVSSEFQPSVKT